MQPTQKYNIPSLIPMEKTKLSFVNGCLSHYQQNVSLQEMGINKGTHHYTMCRHRNTNGIMSLPNPSLQNLCKRKDKKSLKPEGMDDS